MSRYSAVLQSNSGLDRIDLFWCLNAYCIRAFIIRLISGALTDFGKEPNLSKNVQSFFIWVWHPRYSGGKCFPLSDTFVGTEVCCPSTWRQPECPSLLCQCQSWQSVLSPNKHTNTRCIYYNSACFWRQTVALGFLPVPLVGRWIILTRTRRQKTPQKTTDPVRPSEQRRSLYLVWLGGDGMSHLK